MFSTLFLEFQNWALISGEWGAGWCLTGVFCMIQMLIKNTLREVENYPTYGIPNILREVGNHPNGYLEFTNKLRDVGNPSKN